MSRTMRWWLMAWVFGCVAFSVCAADYPDRPVKLIVPFPPGGSTYLTATILAGELQKLTGQAFPIDVKIGNNSITAQEELYKATSDGYTLLVGTIITNSLVPVAHRRKFSFDYYAAIVPVARLADFPSILVTSPTNPADTIKGLLELRKSASAPLKNGTDFSGSTSHLASVLLGNAHGIRVEQVFINGATGLLNAASNGAIDIVFLNSGTAGPAVKAGKVKALAVTGDRRLADFPNVPTMNEAGFGGYASGMWQGLFARSGTPTDLIKRLHQVVAKAMTSDHARAEFSKANATITLSSTSEQFAAELKIERAQWEKALEQAGLVLD
jgi:tripartite-type tricarboxylate transporter receptor subunit TctC